jgi:hypothetical protein
MKKLDLIKELKKIPGNPEVEVKYSYFSCSGHGPDEYCYCPFQERQESPSYLVLEDRSSRTGEKLKENIIVIYL